MSGGILIAILALLIPITAIVTQGLRKLNRLAVRKAEREVELRRRFRAYDEIERRVADIERHVTSPEFHLNREIGRLAGKP